MVDTGSTDRTKEIAAGFGARVFDFAWVDSFAAARNESLRHATGEWIFWLDADDRLDDDNRQRLKGLFAGLPDANVAFVMKCLCLPDPETRTATVVDHVRLFRNEPSLRWDYRVHEQILPSLRRSQAEVRWSDVVIQHVGYQDTALRQRKLARDGRLLQMEFADKPDDPFVLFNLGSIAQELGRLDEAVPLLRRSLEMSQPGDSIVRKLYALLAQCHRRLGQDDLALAACRKGREFYPDDVELLFQEGIALREKGDRSGAKACWTRLLRTRKAEHFASIDTGLCGYKVRHNLAQLDLEGGDLPAAERHWRAALAEQPGFAPAWLGLGAVCLRQERWDDLEGAARELANSGWPLEGNLLRAQRHMAQKEFGPACRLLAEAIAQAPEQSPPRRLLSHALLQEGRDWGAAERALQELLALEPNDAEARNNLAVLARRRHPQPEVI